MNTALEISAATGKPLGAVVEALVKYNDGNTGALKRLGITMGEQTRNYGEYAAAVKKMQDAEGLAAAARETYGPKSKEYADAQKKVAAAAEKLSTIKGQGGIKWLSELNTQFKGGVASRMDTTAGAMSNVATAASELSEALGVGILGKDDRASSEINDLADAMYEAQPTAEAIGGVIHDLALALADVSTYLGPIVEKFQELNNLGDGFLTNGVIVNTMKAINGDFTPGNVVTGTAPGNTLTPAQLAAIARGSVTSGDFYSQGGLPSTNPVRVAQRYKDATQRADSRTAQKDARTRTRP
jgi:hypothetical protein